MNGLTIEKTPCGSMTTVKITGWRDGELNELKSMEHREAREAVLAALDDRNGNLGTQYQCGYGVYGLWFDNEAVYLNIGNTCD